jgi:hypothetical protein
MSQNKLNPLVHQMENYLECWKQFNNFLGLARDKKFGEEDESHFLELKSILVQELELILAGVEITSPTREDVHALIGNAPSIRYLGEMSEGALRNIENQWHKIYIGWHAILGQLKVQQRADDQPRSGFASVFGMKK